MSLVDDDVSFLGLSLSIYHDRQNISQLFVLVTLFIFLLFLFIGVINLHCLKISWPERRHEVWLNAVNCFDYFCQCLSEYL